MSPTTASCRLHDFRSDDLCSEHFPTMLLHLPPLNPCNGTLSWAPPESRLRPNCLGIPAQRKQNLILYTGVPCRVIRRLMPHASELVSRFPLASTWHHRSTTDLLPGPRHSLIQFKVIFSVLEAFAGVCHGASSQER